jgi:lysine 2,3-aminomutase
VSKNKDWLTDLRNGILNANDLGELPVTEREREQISGSATSYKVRVPQHYLQLIQWDDPKDPIRLQAIPSSNELRWDPRELSDPIGDTRFSPVPRLTHRYPNRVILYPTYQCAIYCRHCFRKELLTDADSGFSKQQLAPALTYIRTRNEIKEVILTGGDPFMISDCQLGYLREELEAIPHLRMLRIHTRVPVVLPSKVTEALVAVLKGRLQVCVVTHFNHPREITEEAADACRLIREAGFMLLNQSVLLRGVNDEIGILRTLCEEVVYTLGAKPYYLHHCDLTRGLSYLRTEIERGLELMRQLRGYTSGVCIPTYVLDLPRGRGKIPLGPSYVQDHKDMHWRFSTYDGDECEYDEVLPPDVE